MTNEEKLNTIWEVIEEYLKIEGAFFEEEYDDMRNDYAEVVKELDDTQFAELLKLEKEYLHLAQLYGTLNTKYASNEIIQFNEKYDRFFAKHVK